MKFFFFFLILFSCAEKPVVSDLDSVSSVDPSTGSLSIDESKSYSYGPSKAKSDSQVNRAKEPVVGLILYPSLYHSQAIVYALKKLEEENINISIISSYGFGSLIAALYAQKKSVSYVEWKLFGLLKKLKNKKIYGSDWKEEVDEFIKKEFGNKKPNQLKVLLLVPEYRDGTLSFNMSAKVKNILNRSLLLSSKLNPISKIKPLSEKLKNKFSTDLVESYAFIPKYPSVTSMTGLEYGVVTSHLGKMMSQPDLYGVVSVEKKESLDDLNQLTGITNLYKDVIDQRIQELKNRIKVWKEENTEALNNH